MPWLSRNNFTPDDKLHADDLNNLANDDRTWGGNVNGGGYTLSNVNIVAVNPQAGGGGVTSFNSRNGDVMPQSGDYTAALVGAVPLARQIIAGPGLTGGGPLSADVTLNAAVTSVFGRTGAVVLTSSDITNATGVLNTRRINTLAGSGLTGGGPLTGDLNLSVVPDTTQQQVQIMSQGSLIGSPRSRINFVSGNGALVSVSEISASNRIDVTISSTGTGGFVDPTQLTGDLIVRGLTAPATRLPVGSDGQVLTADHLQSLGVKWATPSIAAVTSVFGRVGAVAATGGDYTAAMVTNAVDQTGSYVNPPWITSLPWSKITNAPLFMLDPTVAKGDLIVHGATTARLPLGADGSILTADSSLALGVRWGAVAVTSVFGRTGAVVAQAGDYTVAQVTGAVPNTVTINTPVGSGLTGGGNLSSNRTLSVVADTTNQQVQVLLAGSAIATRHAINFTSGAGVALTIADSTTNNWVDITVSSTGSGGGGGMVDPTTAKGDLIVRGPTAPPVALPLGTQGQVLTVDTAQLLGVRWATPASGGAGAQTPWVSDIDAGNHKLNNVAGVGVNIAASATARVYAFVNATEDGFRAVTNSAAGMAAASFINDIGDSVCIRSYGTGFVGGLPGLATLEATNQLAFFANAAEVMRLNAGHVLIGTTTDDATHALQVNGSVKSLSGGYVFPDGTTQITAYTSASSPVTSVFTRTGAVVAQAGDYTAALVTNAVDSSSSYNNPSWITSLAWSKITGAPALLVDPTTGKGDLIARGATGPATRLAASTTNNWVLTADSAATLGVKWAATPQQTPWASHIDAAGYSLFNVGNIGIGTPSPAARLHVNAAAAGFAPLTGTQIFVSNSGGPAYIECASAASSDSCGYLFSSGGSLTSYIIDLSNLWSFVSAARPAVFNIGGSERLRITTAGKVGVGVMPQYVLHVAGPSTAPQFAIGVDTNPLYNLQFTYNPASTATIQSWNNGAGSPLSLNPSGGNVGIGTASPAGQLSLGNPTGDSGFRPWANMDQGCFAFYQVQNFPAANNYQRVLDVVAGGSNTGGNIRFVTQAGGAAGTSAMLITPAGNVGIGTQAPSRLLQIQSPAGVVCSMNFTQTGWASWDLGPPASSGDFVITQVGTAERVRVTNAGNVGIGTVPQFRFDVNGGRATFSPSNEQYAVGFRYVNTGPVFWQGADLNGDMIFSEAGGTERMRIKATGTVGIGTNAPNAKLGIIHGANPTSADTSALLSLGESSNNPVYGLKLGYFLDGGTYRSVIQGWTAAANGSLLLNPSGGNVAIGTTNPVGLLHLASNAAGAMGPNLILQNLAGAAEDQEAITFRSAGADRAQIRSSAHGADGYNGTVEFWTGITTLTEKMRLSGNGNLGIGTNAPGYPLHVVGYVNATSGYLVNGVPFTSGIAGMYVQNNGSAAIGPFQYMNFQPSAQITWSNTQGGPGNNTINILAVYSTSDIRLKQNVTPLEGGLPIIGQLRPVRAEWNGLGYRTAGQPVLSVIAQELQAVVPDAVSSFFNRLRPEDEEDTELLAIDPMAIVAHLILAIQQLESRLRTLEGKVN